MIATTALLLVGLSLASWLLTSQLNESLAASKRVSHTHQVMSKIEGVVYDVSNIETGSREYYITANQDFLEPYHSGLSTIDDHIQDLNQLVADNPQQLSNIEHLLPLIAEKRNTAEQIVIITEKHGPVSGSARDSINLGKQTMDKIRHLVNDMLVLEQSQLKIREANENRLLKRNLRTQVFLNIVRALVLIGFAALVVNSLRKSSAKVFELENIAYIDSLTGLSTRRAFMGQGKVAIAHALRYGGPLSLLIADLDYFKKVNDTYGHYAGDIVLKTFGAMCQEALRDVDIIGRIGGEEFAILLPSTDGKHAVEVAERLRQAVATSIIALGEGKTVKFTVSIGIVILKKSDTNIASFIARADKALYTAKRAGRNRVQADGLPPYSVAVPSAAQYNI